ncbi:MAG: 50S ribosomal protein L5 [uncultured bacterium]|nr:MAG: 50S ribosomal protein L5 [uncultured bacterium]HCU70230.1 50S ribosomal protein L5 [Candidatus Moranbacteria bacterium]
MYKSIKEKYNKDVVSKMKEQFGFKSALQVPRIEKVVINVGIGKFIKDSALVEDVKKTIVMIAGQKPVMTQAKKSIAGFKIREGQEIGMRATLRGKRKWDFIEKLVSVAIPRVRDFQGIKDSAVDAGGNFNFGIKEHTIFSEIMPESVKNIVGFQVNIVTTAKNREEGLALFKLMGFPLKKD